MTLAQWEAIIGKLSVNSCQTVVFFVLDHFLCEVERSSVDVVFLVA